MIVLDNDSKMGSCIVIENGMYSVIEEEKVNLPIQGVGGFSEDMQLIGVFIDGDRLFFINNNSIFETAPNDLKCTNKYISKSERSFVVEIGDRKVCEIVYKPFIDPGMIYYDADPEEFDFLLRFSNMIKDQESIQNFIRGMHIIKERYKG